MSVHIAYLDVQTSYGYEEPNANICTPVYSDDGYRKVAVNFHINANWYGGSITLCTKCDKSRAKYILKMRFQIRSDTAKIASLVDVLGRLLMLKNIKRVASKQMQKNSKKAIKVPVVVTGRATTQKRNV